MFIKRSSEFEETKFRSRPNEIINSRKEISVRLSNGRNKFFGFVSIAPTGQTSGMNTRIRLVCCDCVLMFGDVFFFRWSDIVRLSTVGSLVCWWLLRLSISSALVSRIYIFRSLFSLNGDVSCHSSKGASPRFRSLDCAYVSRVARAAGILALLRLCAGEEQGTGQPSNRRRSLFKTSKNTNLRCLFWILFITFASNE